MAKLVGRHVRFTREWNHPIPAFPFYYIQVRFYGGWSVLYLLGMQEYGTQDGHDVGLLREGSSRYTEEAFELLEGDGDGRTRHEPHDGRVREIIDDEAKPTMSEI